MFAQSDLVYMYDGTTDGFLCCVFESFLCRETPADILVFDSWQPCLFRQKSVETDRERADRVRRWLEAPERKNTYAVLRRAWLTALPQKELHILRFLLLVQDNGEKAWEQVQEPSVMALHAAFVALGREIDKYMGFVRFSDYGGVLVGVIEPKNFVLPLLQNHFCGRLGTENFLLYDKTHATALVSRRGAGRLLPLDGLELDAPDAAEAEVRALWRRFYNTIAIEERVNPKLQRNMVPLRYRSQLTEFGTAEKDGLSPAPSPAAPLPV